MADLCCGIFTFLVLAISLVSSQNSEADLVLLKDAVNEGAVCLDGTPPGYYFRKGMDDGADKWIVYFQGGGWCYDKELCLERSRGELGSSKSWPSTMQADGIMSSDKDVNPDFYQWNVAYLKYCDGASFAGDVEKPVDVDGTMIHFRGFRVLRAILRHLNDLGMKQATEVILSGSSAGGLATYLHADYVQSVLQSSTKFHVLGDAGYFLDAKNTTGQFHLRENFSYVYKMQNCSGGVNQDCIRAQASVDEHWKCFFAQYTYPHIKSSFFSLNSQVDTWQLQNVLQLGCKNPPINCTDEEIKQIGDFYQTFMNAAAPILESKENGCFLDSCLMHVASHSNGAWDKLMVEGQSLQQTFGIWYFKREGKGKVVDCAYPCNKSCL